jgi:hypothetical protein
VESPPGEEKPKQDDREAFFMTQVYSRSEWEFVKSILQLFDIENECTIQKTTFEWMKFI